MTTTKTRMNASLSMSLLAMSYGLSAGMGIVPDMFASSPMKYAKPEGHGRPCKRSKAERNARKRKRRQRAKR